MPTQPLDLNFLNDLLSQPDKAPRTKKLSDTRDNDTWFSLFHKIMGTCSNENCISIEMQQPRGRNRVTADVNGHEMCRFCFLYGWHHNPSV
jgi:hypothetical protein